MPSFFFAFPLLVGIGSFFFFFLRCRFFFGLQDCIVCQELYTVGATLVRLPCGHLYHEVSKSYVQLQSVPGV